jgi:hypothetical protein
MRDLNYQLKMLCKHSHEGSFETRVGRERQLTAIANQLHELGFRQLKATSLKQKHVQALGGPAWPLPGSTRVWLTEPVGPASRCGPEPSTAPRRPVPGIAGAAQSARAQARSRHRIQPHSGG